MLKREKEKEKEEVARHAEKVLIQKHGASLAAGLRGNAFRLAIKHRWAATTTTTTTTAAAVAAWLTHVTKA
ncbi:hypothetical protein ACS0PU_011039 [Formica fusca]